MKNFAFVGAAIVGIALVGCEKKSETSTPDVKPKTESPAGDSGAGSVTETTPAETGDPVETVTQEVQERAQEVVEEVKQEAEAVTNEAKSMMTDYVESLQALITSVASVDGALSAATKLPAINSAVDSVKSYSEQFEQLAPGVQDQLKEMFAGQLGPLKTSLEEQIARFQADDLHSGIASMLQGIKLP